MASEQPWFKFYAADYLLDPKVDAMPREAEALLLRMWCVCHREGSCPADPGTLARKTQCSLQYVLQCKPQCEPFFELRDGKFYSRRMEQEKHKSEIARKNANERYKEPKSKPESESEPGSANGSASGTASGSANHCKRENKASRIPKNFIPKDEHYAIAAELGINCAMEFQKFRDYFLRISGPKGIKQDWDATLRNWLRNSVNFGGGRANGREPTKAEQRVINSRRNILQALGDDAGRSGTGVSVGDSSGANASLVGVLPTGKT
jgi:uncharacterized protein YdaU (DUF1376 family)